MLHFGGFELVAPELLDRRLKSGMEKFPRLWDITASGSRPKLSEDGAVMSWQVSAEGADWRTSTDFAVFRWDRLIEPYRRGALPFRVVKGYLALAGFLLNGTIGRYFAVAPRYGAFSVYPFAVLIVALLVGLLVSGIARALGLPYAPVTALILWAVVWVAVLWAIARATHLDFALDHWTFAGALAKRQVPGLDATLDRFAREIIAAVKAGDADEVVISGTSLGAVIAVEAVARAVAIEPRAFRRGAPAVLLLTGSSLLQVGLHPRAAGLRSAVAATAVETGLYWLEIQMTVDPMNFCNTDPVRDLGIAARGPVVRVFRLRDLMTAEAYRRIRYDHVRLHRQYVMPNGRRHSYDFYMICFGPLPLPARAELIARHGGEEPRVQG